MPTDESSSSTGISNRRLWAAAGIVVLIILTGALGFSYFDQVGLLDGLYISVQTVTTVGYGDLAPKTQSGRLFAIFLMLSGVGTVLYALTVVAQSMIQSEIVNALQARRKYKQMKNLRGHYIVCGAGRVGRKIIRQLADQKIPYIVIENDEGKRTQLEQFDPHLILGDATSEENLVTAGVEHAKGLASCLPNDAANVYVVLTARQLNPDLHIVARAIEEQAEPTLIRAGASRVIAPTIIGGQSMARALLRPAVADFMDSIVAGSLELVFAEIAIADESPYAGRKLKDIDLKESFGIIVVAIRKKDGSISFNPSGEAKIESGDLLIVIGKAESVQKLGS